MIKKLSRPTGSIDDTTPKASDTPSSIERPAILVHSGPNGEKITFQSADGDISFDEKRIRNIVANHNAKINELAAGYGGLDKMPAGAYPPILDQHENDSNNRIIGRLASLLRFERRDVPGVGKNVSCALANITFLGEETVERVLDGRVYHLSIGIDEGTDTLMETSTVITPAAPGAMLLKQGTKKVIQKPKMEKVIMSKRLQAHAKKMAKLATMKESLSNMKGKLVAANNQVKLTKKQGEVTHRLTNLIRSGKLTPAEYKKMDVKKLSALEDSALNTVLGTIEAMEPKVMAGQRGSTDSIDFTSIGKSLEKTQKMRLKAEIRKDFKRMGKKLVDDGSEEDKDHGDKHEMEGGNKIIHDDNPGKDPGAIPGQAGDEAQLAHAKHMCNMVHKHLAHHQTMAKHLAAGDIESAKSHHEEMMTHAKHMAHHMGKHPNLAGEDGSGMGEDMKHLEFSDVKSEDYKQANDGLQAQIDELNTQIARIAGMVDELMEVEKEEGEEFAHEAETHKDLEGEIKDDIAGKEKEKEALKK